MEIPIKRANGPQQPQILAKELSMLLVPKEVYVKVSMTTIDCGLRTTFTLFILVEVSVKVGNTQDKYVYSVSRNI